MIKEGKFGVQETVALVTIAITNKIFFTSPGLLTNFVGNAGWQMTLISCASTMFFFTILYYLLKRFPGMDVVEIFNISLGRVLGFICSFMITAFFLIGAGVVLREFSDSLKIFIFPFTPLSFMNLSAMIAVTLIVSLGLETIARFALLIAKSLLFIYLLLLVLGIKNYHLLHMFPFWGYGIDQTVAIGVKRTGSYAEILIIAVIAGSLQGASHIKKAGYLSLILSGILIAVGLLCYTFTFEYTTNQELAVPFYTMVRAISYGSFVQKMDPLIMFSWTVTTLVLIAILFYCAVSVFCKMHKINDTRPIILPMAVLIFVFAMIPEDFSSVVEIYIQYQREFGAILLAVLPGSALIAAVIRKKRGDRSNA